MRKFEVKNPIYEGLSQYKSHKDPEVSFWASYAQQGLVRISSDESTAKMIFRKVGYAADALQSASNIARSVATVALPAPGAGAAYMGSVPKDCINIYKNVKELVHYKIKPALWYHQLRIVENCYDHSFSANQTQLDAHQKDKGVKEPKEQEENDASVESLDRSNWNFYRGYTYLLEALIEKHPKALKNHDIANSVKAVLMSARELSFDDGFNFALCHCKKKDLPSTIKSIKKAGETPNYFHLIYITDKKDKKRWYFYNGLKNIRHKIKGYVSDIKTISDLNDLSIEGKTFAVHTYDSLHKIVENKVTRHAILSQIAAGLDYNIKPINDVWMVGRLSRLWLRFLEPMGCLSLFDVEQCTGDIKKQFYALTGVTKLMEDRQRGISQQGFVKVPESQMALDALEDINRSEIKALTLPDHLRCIKDGLALIVLTKDPSLQTLIIENMAQRYLQIEQRESLLLGVNKGRHPIQVKRAVGQLQKEILNAWRYLIMYSPEKDKANMKTQISEQVNIINKESDEKSKARSRIESRGLNAIDQIKTPEYRQLDVAQNALIKEAKYMLDKKREDAEEPDPKAFIRALIGEENKASRLEDLKHRNAMYIPIDVKREGMGSDTDLQQVMKGFLDDKEDTDQRVLLLTGIAGSGKSMFCFDYAKNLAMQMSQLSFEELKEYDGYIPILVFLPLIDNLNGDILKECFQQGKPFKFNDKQVEYIRTHHKVLFIFDAYDETNKLFNVFLRNNSGDITWKNLTAWDQAKFIITCREDYLGKLGKDFKKFFMISQDRMRQHRELQYYKVSPFTPDKIANFVEKYLKVSKEEMASTLARYKDKVKNPSEWYNAQTFLKYINGDETTQGIPGLKNLVTTPLLLNMSMILLPKYAVEFEEQGQTFGIPDKTKYELYRDFMDEYFHREWVKIEDVSMMPADYVGDLKEGMRSFCQRLATVLNDYFLHPKEGERELEPRPAIIYYRKPKNEKEKQAAWYTLFHPFFNNDPHTEIERRGCPLRSVGLYRYQFMHDELREHFYAEVIYNDLMDSESSDDPYDPAYDYFKGAFN